MPSIRNVGVCVTVTAAALVFVFPVRASAETGLLDLHLEGGAATFLSDPQQGEYFGWGGAAATAFEWSVADLVGFEAQFLFAGFSAGDGDRARSDGRLFMIGAGVRLRPLNDADGFLWHVGEAWWEHQGNAHGDLWLGAHAGYVRTGDLDRVGFDAGLGYEFSLWDGLLLGPYVRYFQIVHWNDPLDARDALGLAFGLAGTVCLTTCSVHVPPPDTDGDGLNDRIDRCPQDAEDPDGFEDDDGCPDPDNDGDGIPDDPDRCPIEPEDYDGHHDYDGCPEEEIDTDGDTLLDEDDRCPTDPEDFDGFEDADGCPERDNDEDGFPDDRDDCPDDAEVVNGVEDDDGCPDEALAYVEHDRIILEQMVHFEFGTAVLRRESMPVLEAVARLILAHPEFERIDIDGYADYQGDERFNLWLSQRRADRIRDKLIEYGVEPERLEARGHGEANPIAEGQSIDANRQNRRVEFVITQIGRIGP